MFSIHDERDFGVDFFVMLPIKLPASSAGILYPVWEGSKIWMAA